MKCPPCVCGLRRYDAATLVCVGRKYLKTSRSVRTGVSSRSYPHWYTYIANRIDTRSLLTDKGGTMVARMVYVDITGGGDLRKAELDI
jgi:hypothetical protein